jgi:hypothetical protein
VAICKPSESYLAKLRERYRQARKKARGQILTEFVATTGYQRKHAIAVLRGSRGQRKSATPRPRHRRRIYRAEDKRAVLMLADLFRQIGSKRLRAAMDVEIDQVRDFLKVSPACFKRLRQISPATMDRLRRTVPLAAARNLARCSSPRFQFGRLPIGTRNAQGLLKLTSCNMMAGIPAVFSPVP